MLLDQYEYFTSEDRLTYKFTSEGRNGSIVKIVQYSKRRINGEQIYNLGFGDLGDDNKLNDKATSNNGDMLKVLNTVANTIFDFAEFYPDEFIYATGSDAIRTKLYQRKITEKLEEISIDFDVYGIRGDKKEIFNKDVEYTAFLIKRK